jgi:MBG domain (YGX type)/YDG domain
MHSVPPKTQRSRSTRRQKVISRGSLVTLLAVLITSGLEAAAAPALDGEGAMTVSPTSVAYGSTGNTFTFMFTANIGDFTGAQVSLTIPAGWTPATTASGAGHIAVSSGTATLQGNPPYAVTSSNILVDIASCIAGQYFTVTYSGVTAPAMAGSPYTFVMQTDIGVGGQGLVNTTAPFPVVTVTPATLTVGAAGLTTNDKIYDGTTTATLVPGTPTLVGVIGTDVVTLVTTGTSGTFADKNVGTAKTVTIAGLTLTGANASNYTLTQPTRTANITTRPITVSAGTDTKTYDGTTSSIGVPILSAGTPLAPGDTAPVWTQSFDNKNAGTGKSLTPAGAVLDGTTSSSGVPILSAGTPLAPGDTAPAWTQTFDTKNAGTSKSLTPAGRVIDGNGGLNYAYSYIPVTTGIITAAPLVVSAAGVNKVYDGATAVTVTLSDNRVTGDVLTTGYGSASFGDKNVGTGKAVNVSGITLTGADAGNYTHNATASTTASITAATLAVSAAGVNKVYDGATAATVTLSDNRVTGDVLTTGYGNAAFADKNVGTAKTVSVSGITLTGADAANYTHNTTASTTANITAATLAVSATGVNKVYDGTTAATVTLSDNRVAGDVLTTGYGNAAFADKNVGTAKAVSVSGITLTGADAANYTHNTTTSTTADITAATLAVSAAGVNKVYDGATTATVTLSDNRVAGDVLTTGYGNAAFADKNVGTGKSVSVSGITLIGADAANYTHNTTASTTADISPAPLVVTALDASRAYGQPNPVFKASYTGFVNGETNTVLGGTLVLSTTADSSSPVGTYPITASGLTAINYSITYSNGTLTITPLAPTVLSITLVNTADVAITWSAISNRSYRVQYNPVLGSTNWTDLTGDVTATGNTACKTDPRTTTDRFYRVQVLP